MDCPICKKEMLPLGEPQLALKEVMEVGHEFPIKIICYLYRFFHCDECKIKVSQADTKEYI
jgi:hypothetical protein